MTGTSYNSRLKNAGGFHVVIAIPCLSTGGTERQTLMMARVLAGIYRVTLVCYYEYTEEVIEEFKKAGIEVILLKRKRSEPVIRFVSRLSRVFREINPDVIHVQYMAPGFLPVFAARMAGVRCVLATINYHADGHGFLARILVWLAAMFYSKFICVSQAVEQSWFGSSSLLDPDCPSIMHGKHVCIHNAVDLEAIDSIITGIDRNAIRSRLGLADAPLMGTVSRLSREKGVDFLVDVFAKVRMQMPGIRLLVVGDGPEKANLEKQASEVGIADAVTWVGRCSWEDAVRYLSVMDLVAVPSRHEGFGLAAAEARACTIPVVAS